MQMVEENMWSMKKNPEWGHNCVQSPLPMIISGHSLSIPYVYIMLDLDKDSLNEFVVDFFFN